MNPFGLREELQLFSREDREWFTAAWNAVRIRLTEKRSNARHCISVLFRGMLFDAFDATLTLTLLKHHQIQKQLG